MCFHGMKARGRKHVRIFACASIMEGAGACLDGRGADVGFGYFRGRGPWTRAPTTFSNEYFRLLIETKWVPKQWKGPKQFGDDHACYKHNHITTLVANMCPDAQLPMPLACPRLLYASVYDFARTRMQVL